MYKFNPEEAVEKCVEWIQDFFEKNGKGCNAIVGISGGKDSSVVSALLVKALGKDRVIGVLLPNGVQPDIDKAYELVNHLGIKHTEINIKDIYDAALMQLKGEVTEQTRINIQPRIRMTMLYAYSQSHNGRVANTCNLSEDWVGYSTRYGDSVGDFSPISSFTVTEVKQMGYVLGLPVDLIEKVPSDGICSYTDEDKLGFTYKELDEYIREGIEPTIEKKKRIDTLHVQNQFKLELMPSFKYVEE